MIAEKENPFDNYRSEIIKEAKAFIQDPVGKDIYTLVSLLDDLELDPNIEIDSYSVEIAAFHLLSYIIALDFVNVKHLWKRIRVQKTESFKNQGIIRKDEKLASIFGVIKASLTNQYADMMKNIKNVEKSFSSNEVIKNLAICALPILRVYILRKLTQEYVSVPLADVSKALDLDPEQTISLVKQHGWKQVDKDFLQTPEKRDLSDKEFRKVTETQFANLSQTISFLETI